MKKQLLTLLLCLCTLAMYAQEKSDEQKLAEFVSNINVFTHMYPQEKVYLHFDNTSYFKGDAIWFKAYVVTAENNDLSSLSKVLYVELLTPEGEVAETKKLKIEDGHAQGAFILEDKLYAGYYEVRAYTRCMLNFGEEVIFSRVFPIYDMPKKVGDYSNKRMSIRGRALRIKSLRKEEKSKEVNLTFFPEGGHLVAGLSNRVAFKATDKEGKPLELTGKVYNSQGEAVTSFSSLHLGMGSFLLSPDGKEYEARVSYNNKEYKFELPQSQASGYTMQVENLNPKTIAVQIAKSADLPTRTLGITFSCRGKVYGFDTFSVNEAGEYSLRLPKENLPSGVVQITLFTPQGEILAQRQAFVNNNVQALPIQVTKVEASFEPFTPIAIDFEIREENKPVETTFSLAVRDKRTTEATNYTDNILYNLLLSSDLKGYIEDPDYYFEADDNKHRFALDLLMLVQGWTRYDWKQAAGVDPFEVRYGIESQLMLEGSILSPGKAEPQEDVQVTMWMSSTSGESQQGKCVTDKDGKFNFGLEDIIGSFDITLYAKKKNKKGEMKPYRSRIVLDRNISPEPLALSYPELHHREIAKSRMKEIEYSKEQLKDSLQIERIESSSKRFNENPVKGMTSYQLKEVEVKADRTYRQRLLEAALEDAFIHHDVIEELDKFRDTGDSESGNLLEFLYQMDPDFSYVDTAVQEEIADGITRTVFKPMCWYGNRRAYILIEYQHPETLNIDINSLTIDEVEHIVIEGSTINVFLNENIAARRNRVGLREGKFEGYSYVLQFYAPDYSITTLPEPDVRRTLYWNPNVKTDKEGKARVEFYNNGTCKQLDISAEGLHSNVPMMYVRVCLKTQLPALSISLDSKL